MRRKSATLFRTDRTLFPWNIDKDSVKKETGYARLFFTRDNFLPEII